MTSPIKKNVTDTHLLLFWNRNANQSVIQHTELLCLRKWSSVCKNTFTLSHNSILTADDCEAVVEVFRTASASSFSSLGPTTVHNQIPTALWRHFVLKINKITISLSPSCGMKRSQRWRNSSYLTEEGFMACS